MWRGFWFGFWNGFWAPLTGGIPGGVIGPGDVKGVAYQPGAQAAAAVGGE